jgi:hypothetical protein
MGFDRGLGGGVSEGCWPFIVLYLLALADLWGPVRTGTPLSLMKSPDSGLRGENL